MDLTTQTPVEIDTQIAAIYVRYYVQVNENQRPIGWLADAERNLAEAKGEVKPRYLRSYYSERDIPRLEKQVAELTAEVEEGHAKAREILKETAPFNAEFKARGGWSRFYLVDNAGGHVHSSMSCSTCYPTTQFIWLPEESGKNEAEIIEKANEQACTVCFPGAPVDRSRLGIYEAPARKAAREEREAKKAEIAAKKAAKALFADDVERVIKVNSYDRVGTIAAAKSWLTNGFGWGNWNHPSYTPEMRDAVAQALADRTGESVEDILAAAAKRAAKRK